MSQPVPRKRRSASRFFLLIFLLAAAGTGIWWKFFREPADPMAARGVDPLPPLRRFEDQRPLMGTEFQIVLFASSEGRAQAAIDAAFARGEAINSACSDYDPESDLSKLNARPAGTPVPISADLTTVLAHARETADLTNGAFDPTLGPLTTLWRQTRDSGQLPGPDVLATARAATGWKDLQVDLSNSTATLGKSGMKIDLGGIAKGFAVDEMLKTIEQHGISRAMIAAGGDFRLGNPPPGALAWRVELKTFGSAMREAIAVANCAVSTSGDLHQFVDIGGSRYAHIIDPATGLGLTKRTAATIIAPSATQSDPLATFACIAPATAGRLFIGGEIRCRVITIDGPDFDEHRSPNFPSIQTF